MSTINIADKPTLDNISTCTSELTNRGGIRHNGTNPQVYSTNNTWVNLDAGGRSVSPSIFIINKIFQQHDMDNIDIIITQEDTVWTTTVNMGTNNIITINVPYLGKYTISCIFEENEYIWDIDINTIGGIDASYKPKIVSWSTGTDQEIVDLIKAADMGLVDLVTDAGWAVGDTRAVDISAISAVGTYNGISWSVGESHVEQTINLVLMDIGDTSETDGQYIDTACTAYELVTPVKNKDGTTRTNPSFIVGMKDVLGSTSAENGYIHGNTSSGNTWNNMSRKSWCNSAFMSALPDTLRDIFKQVNVISAYNYSSSSIRKTQDYCTLPAAGEVFDFTRPATTVSSTATAYSNKAEYNALKTLKWYQTSSNRIKSIASTAVSSTYSWWERSASGSYSYYNCYAAGNSPSAGSVGGNYGISPMLFI